MLELLPDEREHTQPFTLSSCQEVRDIFGFSALMVGCWACLVNTTRRKLHRRHKKNTIPPPDILVQALKIQDHDSRRCSHRAVHCHSALDM